MESFTNNLMRGKYYLYYLINRKIYRVKIKKLKFENKKLCENNFFTIFFLPQNTNLIINKTHFFDLTSRKKIVRIENNENDADYVMCNYQELNGKNRR